MTSSTTSREVLPVEVALTDRFPAFLKSPAYAEFSDWMSAELAALESKWHYASSPKAWGGTQERGKQHRAFCV